MPIPNDDALAFLLTRRSRPAKTLTGPVPDREALTVLLTAAARTPDHGKLEPWRFIVLEKPALTRLAAQIPAKGAALGIADDKISLLNACLAAGWGANWLSGWASHDADFVQEHLGLAAHERIAGFIHIGTETNTPPDRPRPDLDAITTWVSV